jgi:hypothetical protein
MARKKREELVNQNLIVLRSDELPDAYQAAGAIEASGAQVMHMYGPRVMIGQVPAKAKDRIRGHDEVRSLAAEPVARAPQRMSETEEIGLEAWNLRQSPDFAEAKAERPREGERWDSPEFPEPPDGPGMQHTGESGVLRAPELAAEDMSPYLIGSVAVGIVIVEGSTPELQFSDAERVKVAAEVQEGLTWLANQEPRASVTWAYDIRTVRVNVEPNLNLSGYEPLESLWRNPAMGQLGFAPNFQGVRDYVASLRTGLGTRWGYAGFFTKYPVNHFAYAAKPRVVMHYGNNGWGPDNIDRVFTHETGHIFGCPDEYAGSNCSCTARFGYLQEVNGNCERCSSPFTPCLMAANTWAMCRYTPVHLGWRDTDGDGALDPVDPLSNPVVDWRRICTRFPYICDLLGIQWRDQAPAAAEPFHESIPLFLLRRVLSSQEMAKVDAALVAEEEQYIDALIRKLNTASKEIAAVKRRRKAHTRRGTDAE